VHTICPKKGKEKIRRENAELEFRRLYNWSSHVSTYNWIHICIPFAKKKEKRK